jgi:hypothetical protein
MGTLKLNTESAKPIYGEHKVYIPRPLSLYTESTKSIYGDHSPYIRRAQSLYTETAHRIYGERSMHIHPAPFVIISYKKLQAISMLKRRFF